MTLRPAFVTPFTKSLRSNFLPRQTLSSRPRPLHFQVSLPKNRRPVSMLGPFFPDLSSTNLMKSEIVRKEMGSLDRDYTELAKLGTRYETFDREGKIIFIDRALDVVDRFAVFLTRLRLSDEFMAQMFVKQYQLKLEEFGLTTESLITNTKKSLAMMRTEVDNS